MSLRAYLREVLSEHVALPSMQEWLLRVRAGRGRRPRRPLSVVVVDAAVVVDLICDFPAAEACRGVLASAKAVAAPAHLDAEVLSALGRLLHRAGQLTRAAERVEALATFGATRWPLRPLLGPAWALRDRIATRDALYVALAASLDAVLITTDGRLRRCAAGIVAVVEPAE